MPLGVWAIWLVRMPSEAVLLETELTASTVQYGLALGAQVLGIDGGRAKAYFVLNELGAQAFLDYTTTKDIVREAINITGGGAHAVVVTATSSRAFAQGADMLRVGGTLSCVGIPPGNVFLETPICAIIIKGLHITGNLVGSLKDCLDAVEFVRRGVVRPKISVRPFRELPEAYKELVRGEVSGRIVLDIGSE